MGRPRTLTEVAPNGSGTCWGWGGGRLRQEAAHRRSAPGTADMPRTSLQAFVLAGKMAGV